jgi:hypothetical protein
MIAGRKPFLAFRRVLRFPLDDRAIRVAMRAIPIELRLAAYGTAVAAGFLAFIWMIVWIVLLLASRG